MRVIMNWRICTHRFTPDITVLQELGVSPEEKYVILRFVSWNASHDIGHKGISYENKLKAIKHFPTMPKYLFLRNQNYRKN